MPSKRKIDLGSFYPKEGGNDNKVANGAKFHHGALSWRRDWDQCFSDWTIIVQSQKTKEAASFNLPAEDDGKSVSLAEVEGTVETTYHVRKHVLGAGPRGSQYFARLFQGNGGMTESKDGISRIKLEPSAADAFPHMLDFVYDRRYPEDAKATSSTAVALRFLSMYLGIPTLFDNINQFIERDLHRNNLHTYLQEARIYQGDAIVSATQQRAGESCDEFPVDDDAISCLHPTYMSLLTQSEQLEVWKLATLNAQTLYEVVRSS